MATDPRPFHSPHASLEALVELSRELGVGEEDLDELVHDLHGRDASVEYNERRWPFDREGPAHAALHGAAEVAAAKVNNGGLTDQIRYLLALLGEEQTMQEIRLRA